MAKKRRVKTGRGAKNRPSSRQSDPTTASNPTRTEVEVAAEVARGGLDDLRRSPARRFDPWSIAIGLLGGAIVYVLYYPSDSVAVERGDALWFAFLAIVIATITLGGARLAAAYQPRAASLQNPAASQQNLPAGEWLAISLEWTPWLLAAWMMWAAFASSPPGNLRMATNEAWFWVAAAAIFVASRRLLVSLSARQSILVLLIACGSGLAVHGLHQQFVSLPDNRAMYQRDPERVLQLAGIDAPVGSAQRMVFENRLLDGGPTATFALANSLASALLVAGILALGCMRLRWASMTAVTRAAWCAALMLCAACLLATRSRSAMLAMLLGCGLLFIGGLRKRRSTPTAVLTGLAGFVAIAIAGALALAVFGDPEWFEQAPSSLAFRFQYWRSTWQMLIDRPWYGAGPGNFQSIYERYREASATEQVAEPHNFIFETLASGGFVALALLLTLIAAGVAVSWTRLIAARRMPAASANPSDPALSQPSLSNQPGGASRWLWLGAGLGLVLVWAIGLASRWVPDVEAHVIAVPTAILMAILLCRTTQRMTSSEIDLIVAIALSALLLHLLVAGGWTVPGVAILVWLMGASLTRIVPESSPNPLGQENPVKSRSPLDPAGLDPAGVCWALAGLITLFAIHRISLRPVSLNAKQMTAAAHFQTNGRLRLAKSSLQKAMVADPWSPESTLWMADFYRWQMVIGQDSPPTRRDWESALREAKNRAGDDPAVYSMIGAQQLHLYQRYGQRRDLDAAAETFQKASDWSPANQWMAAQLAVIADARGQSMLAAKMAARALELSKLGGNIERDLGRQLVYVARQLGRPSPGGPVRHSAEDLLSNHLGAGGVVADE